jgi:hypothetical protein
MISVIKTLQHVGRHDRVPDERFNRKQLKMGIKIEKEHTDSPTVAKAIAHDHLSEIPDYYTRLKKMEKDAEK